MSRTNKDNKYGRYSRKNEKVQLMDQWWQRKTKAQKKKFLEKLTGQEWYETEKDA